ncbi:hypothetical protein F5Y08DRAFT_164849 [Xylaria arbuscula]|nr:hypothetical protein F5Y08DRAFT_164849 [Xylaria arbuscula]
MSYQTLQAEQQPAIPDHHSLTTTRSIVAASSTLSSGAIAAITVGGSVFIFLLVIGPMLMHLAKRQDQHRVADFAESGLSFAQHGQFVAEDGDTNGPRRLRKKGVTSEGASSHLGMKDNATSIGGGRGGDSAKYYSLPNLPTVFSRPGSWRISGHLSAWEHDAGDNAHGGGNAGSGNAHGEAAAAARALSPEKHRGYIIYQNRRKTSWIDEDALHGPRVSPKKNNEKKRKSNWFLPGSELTRSLSRHLSFRRFGAPELARSPTLPCIETNREKEAPKGSKQEDVPVHRKTRSTENAHTLREAGQKTPPRFPTRQPVQQGGSLTTPPRTEQPTTPAASVVVVANHSGHSNTVINAAEQLAGRARVPSTSAAGVGTDGGQQQRFSRFSQSNTDADLQAILRRTAERLEDGNRSARRQTLMLPATSSSSIRWSDQQQQPPREHDPECSCNPDRARRAGGDKTPSPARSQKSAPATVSYSELEGCSPRASQGGSQTNNNNNNNTNNTPWQTHKRTRTQQIPQISPLAMRFESGNAAGTPSKYSSPQGGGGKVYGLSPSPNRMVQTPYSYAQQQVMREDTYSPASEKSSALSTVYSEDERSPPPPDSGNEMERRAMTEALRACDAFDGGQTRRDGEVGGQADIPEPQRNLRSSYTSRPLHIRKGTLEQAMPDMTQLHATSASAPKGPRKQPTAMFNFTPESIRVAAEDPFTMHTTPTRQIPQRLSEVFSPVPAELPGDSMTPTGNSNHPINDTTPTPSPSHRRIVPPPFRLRPVTSSPTLGHSPDPELQIEPPTREPSPAVSESGLSSVYDSYRYSRYSDSLEGSSQAMSRLSATTMLTVPPTESSPKTNSWDESSTLASSAEGSSDYCYRRENGTGTSSSSASSRTAHVGLTNAALRAGAYTHFAASALKKSSYMTVDALPHHHPQEIRQISLGNVSEDSSAYSQDEDKHDRLAPLMPFHPATAGKHGMRVTSAVAELRRMNSQVSCVSGYSTATTNIGGDVSPTLPALRGGGCSPGKKGAGGAKNYLSLGKSSPTGGDGEVPDGSAETKRYDTSSARNMKDGSGSYETAAMPIGIKDTVTLRRGGQRRSRGSTVVESFEEDLDRARQVLRESRGYNLQAIPEAVPKNIHPGELRTHGAKSSQDGRTSVMGLGLYDNKGFLRSSRTSKDLTGYV